MKHALVTKDTVGKEVTASAAEDQRVAVTYNLLNSQVFPIMKKRLYQSSAYPPCRFPIKDFENDTLTGSFQRFIKRESF